MGGISRLEIFLAEDNISISLASKGTPVRPNMKSQFKQKIRQVGVKFGNGELKQRVFWYRQ